MLRETDGQNHDEKEIARMLEEEEKSHWQPRHQIQAIALCILLIIMNVLRGSKTAPSIVGIAQCSALDFTILSVYFVICLVLLIVAIRRLQWIIEYKKVHGKGLFKGDVDVSSTGTVVCLLLMSVLGGWICGALGLGGGIIHNQILMSLDVPPKVATATGMWLIMFASLSTVISYAIAGVLHTDYAVWIASICGLGTAIGMLSMNYLMKKLGRQSPMVFLLTFILLLGFSVIFYSGFKQLDGKQDIWKVSSIC